MLSGLAVVTRVASNSFRTASIWRCSKSVQRIVRWRLIGTCKVNGVEPYAYLKDLFTKLANGHLDKDIDALMPWAYAAISSPSR